MIAYGCLLITAIVLFVLKEWQYGFAMLGISLVAMPGNHNKFTERPLWQRTWFVLHFVVLLGAMLYQILSKL
ncbi:hypothetical protein BC343_09310 [Mucilaginibacter pedocola]|uniref:Uncharacterized protein n=1 Tax=Mucilaginibacter pedocola TaxID=1792845 RepID=A0A1S9PCY0_9SPHI|nr:hypothetical protein BC343_09310 [Mucilaginibacter pedocola]